MELIKFPKYTYNDGCYCEERTQEFLEAAGLEIGSEVLATYTTSSREKFSCSIRVTNINEDGYIQAVTLIGNEILDLEPLWFSVREVYKLK